MYFNFENYESKGGSKEYFLNSFTKNYDLENDTYERVQKGIESFNKENNTSFDLYDYLKFNSKKIKFKKKEPLQEQGKEDLKQELAEQKEPLQDENLEENKSFKRKHDLSKESEILNDTSLLSDVKNSLKRGAETLSDVVGLDELVNFDSDIKSKADENIKDLIKQGASYEDLNELEKNYLANKESRENVRDATNIFSKEKSIKGLASLYGTNEEEKAKKAFAEMKSTQEALSKEKFEDLNEQEKELIDKERGEVESFFVNLRDDEYKQKSFDELKEKYEAKNFISKDVLRDLEFLKNIHQSKSVSSLILSADEKEKKDYENSVLNIALNAGFDDVLLDEKEGKMYFEKEGQKYLVNEGFFDNFTNTLLANTGSITGGLIGAAKGASSAKSPQSALAKSIAYSALGSGIGASADVLATNYLLDRKNRFDEMLHHALEESALSAVGDALVLGAKPLLKTAKDSIKDFGKILDYTPLVSTTKNFPTQNIKAAQDLVEKSVDLNTQKELDEFYKAYGGRSDLADSKALDALVDTFKAKFGEDSFISKNTQKLNDILNLNSLSAKQNALFEAIRADESGFLLPYVKEVASYDVRAFKNLKNILNLSTQRLENSLKNMNLNKGDIKGILDELEKGTKEDYNEVMNEILAKTYDDRFKVVLSRSVTPEATSGLNPDSVMTKTPSNYSTLKQNLQEDYDLLDKTKPLRMAREDELNDELLKRAMEGKNKLYIANANLDLQTLGLNNNKDIKITLSSDAMRHILNKHSKDDLPVSLNDFKMIDELINNADLYALSTSKDGQKALLTGKQINGHFIAIETISTKDNELKIKTMYKSNGKLENAKAFKKAEKIAIQRIRPNTSLVRSQVPLYSDAERLLSIENNQAVRSLSPKPSANLDNSHLSTLNNYTTFRKNLQEQGLDIDRGERNILSLKTDLKDEDFFKQRDKIIKDLKANKGEVINSYTNESAILSNAGIKKMSSDKAIAKSVDNGFSKMEHLEAVANIKELFRNSKKLISKGDVKNSDNNLIINRYVSDLNVNDKEARALLTLKEYNENGKRFYSLELENLEPLSSTKRGVNGDKGSFFNGDRDTPSFSAQSNYTKFRKDLQEQGLESLVAFKAPKELSLKEIENTINRFDNVENLKKHLESRVDSKERQALFHLLDSTMGEPQLQWIKNNKDKRLKKFQTNDEKEPYFYLLVTKDKDKTFITHLKTKDLKYLNKELQNADEILKGADIIEGFRQQAGSANNGISPSTSKNNYTKFRKNLQEQGLLDEEALKFLNYVENTIYNPKGVTFTQLNNALKNINSFYKQSTNPGFKEHIKNAVQSFLRDDIKKGINEIFKQDKNLYAKASKLYETSLAEYAQMKELLKASAYKKARNESTTQVKALDELIKYSKGQGKDGLNNLDFLRAKLDEKDVAILEMNLLNRLYEKSLANTDESLRVFDSTSFLNELSSLQNNAFKSKEANEFIELVKGFDKLFKNDAKIALELAPVTAKKEGSALATSAKGAVLQKIVKSGFDLVFRNLGQNVLFGAFKDSIQGAALRYHLKKALQKSDTISEFNTSFKDRLKKGQFNSKTKELSKEFLNEVDKFSKSLDEEVLRDTKASDEGLKDLPKENINKEVAEATPSDTTSQKIIQKIKNEVNVKDLSQSQKDIYDVIVGNKDKAILQGKDLNDIYTLEKGSRKAGLHKILVKHAGLKKTGGLSTDELLDMQRIIKDGDLDENSFTQYNNFIRYAYELKEKDTTLRLVVDEYNDGKKVFDYYSDRNFIDYKGVYSPLVEGSHSTQPVLSKDAEPTTAGDISLSKDKTNSSTNLAKEQEQVEILQAKKQEVLNKIKAKNTKNI